MEWILIIYIYVGIWSERDSVTVTNIPGFTSLANCQNAGAASIPLVSGTRKELRYVCLEQRKEVKG